MSSFVDQSEDPRLRENIGRLLYASERHFIEQGIHHGWYDPMSICENYSQTIRSLIFCWVFILWLQAELDLYKDRVNWTPKCADCNKVLPHGVPAHIYEEPDDYGCYDLKASTGNIGLDTKYGSPSIARENAWDVYLYIFSGFCHLDEGVVEPFVEEWRQSFTLGREDQWDGNEQLSLVADQELFQDLDSNHQGGLNGGRGPVDSEIVAHDGIDDGPEFSAQFSDQEEEAESTRAGIVEPEESFFDLGGDDPYAW
ncbi:hypothetical protein C8J56DRAFT_891207 [Mycena floridula]|nr:hypothetical protein C8J56DRAFT_891207 [Mycena floridula]